jgi:hypothetical protein
MECRCIIGGGILVCGWKPMWNAEDPSTAWIQEVAVKVGLSTCLI